jgi:hypothetical protein
MNKKTTIATRHLMLVNIRIMEASVPRKYKHFLDLTEGLAGNMKVLQGTKCLESPKRASSQGTTDSTSALPTFSNIFDQRSICAHLETVAESTTL